MNSFRLEETKRKIVFVIWVPVDDKDKVEKHTHRKNYTFKNFTNAVTKKHLEWRIEGLAGQHEPQVEDIQSKYRNFDSLRHARQLPGARSHQ